MSDTPTPTPSSERPNAAAPTPLPVQAAGHRSGEGSASVLEHLVQERMRSSHKKAPPREQRT